MNTLWVMRHGLAESQFDTDFNRALSQFGEQQAANVAQQLLDDAIELPERMLVSPFRRTQETAKVVQQTLGLDYEFETEDMLVHFGDHKILGDYLLTLAESRVMIISHMPIVANLCQYLCPASQLFGFQTAQLAQLDLSNDVGQVIKTYLAN